MTTEERRTVNRWRGLTDKQLEELNALDRLAVRNPGDRFAAERQGFIDDRTRCIALRAEYGIDYTAAFRKP